MHSTSSQKSRRFARHPFHRKTLDRATCADQMGSIARQERITRADELFALLGVHTSKNATLNWEAAQ